MATAIVEVAENMADTYFAGIDIALPDDAPRNPMGILFKEQESGYLAGVLAGLTGVGVIDAARERGVLAFGVDADQNYLAPQTVVSSAMKGVTQGTYLAIESVVKDEFKSGNVTLGINDGATGLAPFHDFEDKIPSAVKKAITDAEKDLKGGKVTAPATRAAAGYQQ